MQFYLLLIILLIGGCADNKKEQTISTDTIQENLTLSSLDQEHIELEDLTPIEPLIATHDIKPELFWLIKCDMELINGYTLENGSTLNSLEWASTVYYEPISNIYYFSTIEKTNGIAYDTNNIQDEKAFIEYNPSSLKHLKDPLIYIGSIDFSNRVYIDQNGQQYLKKIVSKIDTSFYLDHNRQVQSLKEPVYPFLDTRLENPEIVLSNANRQYFVVRYLRVENWFTNKYPNGTLIQQPEGDYTTKG